MAEDLALDTKAQATATPEKDLRRWLLEIKLAEKREKSWRKTANEIIDVYRGTKTKANSFNILWANTEVLRPALYNSTPKPDVRRRFRQKDILGRAVAEVAERSLTYCVDAYDLDACLKNDVLDALLPGRGLSRVRYIPKIKQVQDAPATLAAGTTTAPAVTDAAAQPAGNQETDRAEAFQGTHEEVEYEQALCDHVQWDDFIHGPGKTWAEVTWEGFKHRLTRDDLVEKFGDEIGKLITLDDVDDPDLEGRDNSELKDSFKRAKVWEIWDKDGEKVFFVNESHKKGVIYPVDAQGVSGTGEPPLKFKNFFPNPEPLLMVENTGSLMPLPLFELYKEQAKELDRLSARITKIVNACRVRFVHDPTLTELATLMQASDNEGIPAQNARAWMANGGIEKAIWWMPIDKVAAVLKELYVARDACKQVIYEITGLSDILRGSTNPNETLGAQQLKANSSSMRLQRMQREVQRYVRDLIRLLAEVIGEHFSPETLAKMTGLQFPTALQKQEAQLQQPSPEIQQLLSMPTWEDIMGVLKSDMQREYRVDVETDSTVAESLTKDMQGLTEVITSVVEVIQGFGPAVQAGAVKAEAVKSIVMAVVRRARMGIEVEDALEEGIQDPKPQADPKVAADAAKQAQAQQQAQHDQQLAQREQAHQEEIAQREQQLAQAEEQRQQAVEFAKHQREQEAQAASDRMEQQRLEFESRIAEREAADKYEFERWKVTQDNDTKIAIAEISAKASTDNAATAADAKADSDFGGDAAQPKKKPIDAVKDMHGELLQHIKELMAEAAAPTRMERGPDGRVAKIIKGKRVMNVTRDDRGMTVQ